MKTLLSLVLASCVLPATALQVGVAPRWAVRSCTPMLSANVNEQIESLVKENKVMLFMKGNELFPQCGFSNTAVRILQAVGQPFKTFDVLSDNSVREGIKTYSNWPTIPQCYVDGEFIGGCDLLIEMYESGELAEMIEKAAAEA